MRRSPRPLLPRGPPRRSRATRHRRRTSPKNKRLPRPSRGSAGDLTRKRAGLTGGPHTPRDTFASHFLQAVPDISLLVRVLAHSSQRVTEIYSYPFPTHPPLPTTPRN